MKKRQEHFWPYSRLTNFPFHLDQKGILGFSQRMFGIQICQTGYPNIKSVLTNINNSAIGFLSVRSDTISFIVIKKFKVGLFVYCCDN